MMPHCSWKKKMLRAGKTFQKTEGEAENPIWKRPINTKDIKIALFPFWFICKMANQAQWGGGMLTLQHSEQ